MAGEVTNVDPRTSFHWLFVGRTGSGKSNAAGYVMDGLARRQPCEYVICEAKGLNWGTRAAARTLLGMAEAIGVVHGEFERRQDLLYQAGADHITQLQPATPYLFLVLEEAEFFMDNLRSTDNSQWQLTRRYLRNIALAGRKPGVGLIAITQAALTEVFDTYVRKSIDNTFLMRNEQSIAEMFRVKDVNLKALPTGAAYSLKHGRMVGFPQIAFPNVPLSSVYREREVVANPTGGGWWSLPPG